jgi:hypothetical protein
MRPSRRPEKNGTAYAGGDNSRQRRDRAPLIQHNPRTAAVTLRISPVTHPAAAAMTGNWTAPRLPTSANQERRTMTQSSKQLHELVHEADTEFIDIPGT